MRRILLLVLLAVPAFAQWENVGPGVDYRRFDRGEKARMHVSRVDLANPLIRVVSSMQSERGLTTSEFARRNHAIIAVNGDYFDSHLRPVGLAIGACGQWPDTCDRGEGVVAVSPERAELSPPSEILNPPPDWIHTAVSGWPLVVRDCKALSSKELPGSDRFTRSPHARTAVGLTRDAKTMFIVVAEGGEGRGATLAELSSFMQKELGVCSALNLDGGGSSVMLVQGRVVASPRDGAERRVGNHLGVVDIRNYPGCTEPAPKPARVR